MNNLWISEYFKTFDFCSSPSTLSAIKIATSVKNDMTNVKIPWNEEKVGTCKWLAF